MDTKEAIEKLHKEIIIDFGSFSYIKLSQDEAKGIITLLQRGEVYKKLWELAKPDLAENIKQKYLKDTPKVWQEMADEIIKEVKD